MATASDGSGGEQRRLLSIPKEGERIIAPTRRPDGTLRKAIRIRAGYVPQEEVAIYQSKGAQVSPRPAPPQSSPHFALQLKTASHGACFVADEEVGARRAAGLRPGARC